MDENFLVKKNKKEEEKRKKRGVFWLFGKNSKLAFLIIAFVLTLIGLSTSTYAWFTSNFTVSVQAIDVNVSAGSGIQISTDAEHWKSLITIADITTGYPDAVNQVPTLTGGNDLVPVSTVKSVYNATTKSLGLHMYRGTIVNDVNTGTMYLNSDEETDGDNMHYVAFDMFLKLDFAESAGDQQVYFTGTTGVRGGSTTPTNIEYASRMGFVVQGHGASSSTPTALRNLKDTTNAVAYIYEPNYDVHTANGLANGRDNYGITGYYTDPEDTTTFVAYGQTGNARAVPYYGVIDEFEYDGVNASSGVVLNSQVSSKFSPVTPDYQSTKNNSTAFEFLELSPGVTKIRVYMWIEGQDIDCENTASGGEVVFNLGFTLEAPTPSATPTPTPTP